MDFHQVKRVYYTLIHLKLTQVYYRIKYRLIKPKRIVTLWEGVINQVNLIDFPEKQKSLSIKGNRWSFRFLNLEQSFSENRVNWSFRDFGMLWTFNLNYFDWLHQPGMSKNEGLKTLSHYFATSSNNSIILHPYPTSLRIINTAKFICKWQIKEDWIYNEMASDLKFVSRRLEYHLLANHLLENAFALYIGGLITCTNKLVHKGKKLLERELKIQILGDGMHFERSPMYHMIILERLLDALNFANAYNEELSSLLKFYSIRMTRLVLNWKSLDRIPMMQDSTYDISLSVQVLLNYSKSLLDKEYPTSPIDLKESGYRMLGNGTFIVFANVGNIGPSYQPGHSHADELNFELFHKGRPIIVDSGISTYNKNDRRQLERSTRNHNCLCLNNKNTSDVWSGFRVGRRAKVKFLDGNQGFQAEHDGYKPLIIKRIWNFTKQSINIEDEILYQSKSTSNSSNLEAIGRFHINPDLVVEQQTETIFKIGDKIILELKSSSCQEKIWIKEFNYSLGLNKLVMGQVINYTCRGQMKYSFYEEKE